MLEQNCWQFPLILQIHWAKVVESMVPAAVVPCDLQDLQAAKASIDRLSRAKDPFDIELGSELGCLSSLISASHVSQQIMQQCRVSHLFHKLVSLLIFLPCHQKTQEISKPLVARSVSLATMSSHAFQGFERRSATSP